MGRALREEAELRKAETLGLGTPGPGRLKRFLPFLPPAGDFAFSLRAPLP